MRIASVFDATTVADVLRLAGRDAPRRGFFRCAAHADRTPSAHVSADGRAWCCHACGASGGVADLAIALGVVRTRADAARWLENRIRG